MAIAIVTQADPRKARVTVCHTGQSKRQTAPADRRMADPAQSRRRRLAVRAEGRKPEQQQVECGTRRTRA